MDAFDIVIPPVSLHTHLRAGSTSGSEVLRQRRSGSQGGGAASGNRLEGNHRLECETADPSRLRERLQQEVNDGTDLKLAGR